MKTSKAPKPRVRPSGLSPADIAELDKNAAYLDQIASWSKTKQRAWLIQIGALKPNGELNWPKIDHVPLGPRE